MHPLVRDLYKRFVIVGRDYPVAAPFVKEKAKAAFFKNATLASEFEVKLAVARGRWMVKEVIGVIQLKKSTGRSGICPPQQVDRGPVFEDMRVANQMIAAEKNAREHNVLPINNNPSRTFF
mmetsp:Transcript_13855/g.28391  ORF Transcript_13855/g.28391 Transcript_13855/m.28391 type:complete len:121 (+) Transcript_13855:76-438(+)|eukprot:CAMPEP_0171606496 /NCGR_PEP_ID=MMETSP0990-20121206/7798_1 /TAXON_ID=483369 /ORGANISM="non described non described, Strain CCMP2098" /LENGTH=120 /DNA_ID=CAMNT_0012169345 /DNA_START=228 /DNA_END=593 /DNA_ORIENTATION=+